MRRREEVRALQSCFVSGDHSFRQDEGLFLFRLTLALTLHRAHIPTEEEDRRAHLHTLSSHVVPSARASNTSYLLYRPACVAIYARAAEQNKETNKKKVTSAFSVIYAYIRLWRSTSLQPYSTPLPPSPIQPPPPRHTHHIYVPLPSSGPPRPRRRPSPRSRGRRRGHSRARLARETSSTPASPPPALAAPASSGGLEARWCSGPRI